MKIKANLLKYKDPNTGSYSPIPVVVSGEDIANKQDKVDNTLNTTDKTIVGSINELSREIVDQQNQIDNKQAKGNYVKSVNGNTPNENGDVIVIAQVEAPPFADGVEEMTDTTKSYVNTQTGTIWINREETYEKTVVVTDRIEGTEDNPYTDNGRLGSDGGVTTGESYKDYLVTPFIDLTKEEYVGKAITIHLEGCRYIADSSAETYIMSQLRDKDMNVLNSRVYTLYNVNDGLFFATSGITSIVVSEYTVGEITINMPLINKANGVEVGYIRFCGKGEIANSNVYVTYEETRTVTEKHWVDTRMSYGGNGVDQQVLDKISSLNNEGTDPTTIKLLAKPVLDFYNAEAYSSDDYTYSHLEKATYPCRADIPIPYMVKWEHNENAMRTTIAVDTSMIGTLNAYTMKTIDVSGHDNYPIYNLLPNKTYHYKVTHVLSNGSLVEAESGSFTTSNESIRLLYIDGTQNVRDLGGWVGLNGKKVKYGNLIRGATFSDSSFPHLILTGKGRVSLGELKVQAELNLGATDTETSIASNVVYKKIGYNNYASAITTESSRTQFKEALEWIVTRLNSSLPIYMHCQGGCDRTGTLSFQLLGLLGVSESDLAKEYELSSFSSIGYGRLRTTTKAVDTYDYVGMVEAIKTYSGSTLTDKFYNFAIACGVTAETITSFRNLMLE